MSKEWICRVCHKLIMDGKCDCHVAPCIGAPTCPETRGADLLTRLYLCLKRGGYGTYDYARIMEEIEKAQANAHALAEERSDDSQQRVVGGKVEA